MPGPSLIGLTGGIAAGKSEVLAILERQGAETLSTDAVVHELLGTDELRDLLVERWGAGVAPGGEIDRNAIASFVFEQPEELAWLESVLHPRVGARMMEWRGALSGNLEVAVVEVPLLFEAGMAPVFDATIAVIADDEVREARAEARGTGELEVRSDRQLSQDEKADLATHVIRNDGSLKQLEAAVAAIWPKLVEAHG